MMNLSYKVFYALFFVTIGYVLGIKYPETAVKPDVKKTTDIQVWRCYFPEQTNEAIFANEKFLYVKTDIDMGNSIEVRLGDKIAHDCSRRYPE